MTSIRLAASAVLVASTGCAGWGGVAHASSTLQAPVLPAPGTWIQTTGGSIRVLDKQKAVSRVLALRVGETAHFETLAVTLEACDAHAPSVPADAAGRVTITDSRAGEPGYVGWMFANEPWVAMLQSPVYGVRVIGCDTPTPEAVAAAMPPPQPSTAVPSGSATTPAAATPAAPPAPGDLQAPPGQPLGDPDAAPPPAPGTTDVN